MLVTPDPTGPCKLTATAGLAALYMVNVVTIALGLRLVSLRVVVPDASVKAKCNWLVGAWARAALPNKRQPANSVRLRKIGAKQFLREGLIEGGVRNINVYGFGGSVRMRTL